MTHNTQKTALNDMCAVAASVKLGSKVDGLISLANELKTNIAAVRALANELRTNALYCVLTNPGLVIGTSSKAKVKITNAFSYVVAGKLYNAITAATEVAFTATTHDIAADAEAVKEAVYLLSTVANGTVTVTMGTIATGAGNAAIPAAPANSTPFGYVRIAVAAGATPFDATTDLLDAAHLTVAYVNIPYFVSNAAIDAVASPAVTALV